LTDKTRGPVLRIVSKNETDKHVWWLQEIPVTAPAYRLTFQAKGFAVNGVGDRVIGAGCEFKDKDHKWLGYQEGPRVAEFQAKWPASTVPDTREWKAFSFDITPPAGAAFIGIRLTLAAKTPAEASFANVSLTASDKTVKQVLDMSAPPRIPSYHFKLADVSADGVTLKPDWSLDGAERRLSSQRSEITLNGLWAIQPASIGQVPREDDWAFIKVPGRWRGNQRDSLYGQIETSWKSASLDTWQPDNPAKVDRLWLMRQVTLPPTTGRYVIRFAALEGVALRVYWNGEPVGDVAGEWGGEVSLPATAQAGDNGQLALMTLATAPLSETAYLYPTVAERPYIADKPIWHGSIWDVSLVTLPIPAAIESVSVIPSTRRKALRLEIVQQSNGRAVKAFDVTVVTSDGNVALHRASIPATGTRTVADVPWVGARLWTPDDPYLYTVKVTALGDIGDKIDEVLPVRFGFREFWVEGKELKLNGQTFRLRPRMSLQYSPTMSNAGLRRYFSYLKDTGFNCALRPPSIGHGLESQSSGDEFFELADEMGIVSIPWLPINVFLDPKTKWTADATDKLFAYIKANELDRLNNHASVIAYGGFGTGVSEGSNPYCANPATLGVKPIRTVADLPVSVSQSPGRDNATSQVARTAEFLRRYRALDSVHPYLSHTDDGAGDGWGVFTYYNWTPVQEWEEWPAAWASHGTVPFGSTEAGLPYAASFTNHGIPDGDGEPWLTEYAAMRLGPAVYAAESAKYRRYIAERYARNKPSFGSPHDFTHFAYGESNAQDVWAMQNKAIFRTWRTYGVPMGIELFAEGRSFLLPEAFADKAEDQTGLNLKTWGAKPDRFRADGNWPGEMGPALPSTPTGKQTPLATKLGKVVHDNDAELLVYVAGKAGAFTSKDHVFWPGEVIEKQVAVVWDGFRPRKLAATVTATVGEKRVYSKRFDLAVAAGEIKLTPFSFLTPDASRRVTGSIQLTITDAGTNVVVSKDTFGFTIYPREHVSSAKRITAAVFDATSDSTAMLHNIGVAALPVLAGDKVPVSANILVIGRGQLPALQGSPLLTKLPTNIPLLVLEQSDASLQRIGFRAFPTRSRQVWRIPGSLALFDGIENDDLRDWRVSPRLLPEGIAPLRHGYNYHVGYRGTVASVVIETPTSGQFTPLLQAEFDLAMTPLLETQWRGHRAIFSQLSLVDAVGRDPVATRLASQIVNALAAPANTRRELVVVGASRTEALAGTIGARRPRLVDAAHLKPGEIALVGNVSPTDMDALKSWVNAGGTAVVLPQVVDAYSPLSPSVKATPVTGSLLAPANLGTGICVGLGVNDFHARQDIQWIDFGGSGPVADFKDGNGRWILLGFNPCSLDLAAMPYLRLTYRRQCRALAQVVANAGANLDAPVNALFDAMTAAPFNRDLGTDGSLRIVTARPTGEWTSPKFSDALWTPLASALGSTSAPEAWLRVAFDLPEDAAAHSLTLDAGTFDDYDETYVNGVRIGAVTPDNSTPDTAWQTRRVYAVPSGVLTEGRNVVAVRTWNRNAALGRAAIIRGPIVLRDTDQPVSLYAGSYKHSDDPYLQYHW
jgi:hypothetical protein